MKRKENTMHAAEIDVAVLLLFFNNPTRFKKVFEQVKKARPSTLFLYQDGPREGKQDEEGIKECRNIVENGIDWECEVYRWYHDKNVGCDPSEYLSQKWAFSYVDKCIVLEDDDVPSVSFFKFCKELLDKYENDTRIMMISGLNFDEITPNVTSDYFFSTICPIWGWATWRRVIDMWDEKYSFLSDEIVKRQMKDMIKSRNIRSDFIEFCQSHKNTGIAFYETILASNMYLNSGLGITPTKNMINNIGYAGDSTHFVSDFETMPKKDRKVFEMKRYELEGEIKHPHYVIEEFSYFDRVRKLQGWNNPKEQARKKVEKIFLYIKHYGFLKGLKKIISKLRK